MKMKLTLFFAALTALTASARADFTESNLSITLKFYFNATETPTVRGDTESLNYTTATLKNADIIDSYNYTYGTDLALNSRIIRRDEFDDDGEFLSFKILIRDRYYGDVDISDIVTFDSSAIDAVKYSYSNSRGTGSYSAIYERSVGIMVNPDVPDESEEIDAAGLEKITLKTVLVRPTYHFVDLASVNTSLNGYAFFYNPRLDNYFEGIVEGSYKESGARVVVLED